MGESFFKKENYSFLVYGDSVSRGVSFDEEKGKYVLLKDNYPALLQDKLKGIIFNAAKFGNTIIKGISRLPGEVLKHQPDIVVIEFGGNDCDYDWDEIARDPSGLHLPKTDFNTFQKLLKELIASLKQNNIIPVLLTLPPIDADKYFHWVSKNSAQAMTNILTWLGSVTKIYWWQERYNSTIITIAAETGTRWIDVRAAFLQNADYTRFICADGIHPNSAGHQIIATKIFEYVKLNYDFLLKDQVAPSCG